MAILRLSEDRSDMLGSNLIITFANLCTAINPDPLEAHFPVKTIISPKILPDIKVNLPILTPTLEAGTVDGAEFEDYAVELHEWLALLLLESPRVDPGSKVDPYLCGYIPPSKSTTNTSLVKLTWKDFLPASWAHQTFVQVLLAIPRESWFVYCVGGFAEGWSRESKNCTILRLPDAPNEYILWDVS
jgi:ribonuclease P/MRP protein subunit RPP40